MARSKFALILYYRMMAHNVACNILLKAFLKSMKTMKILSVLEIPLRLKSYSLVLFPALNPARFFKNYLFGLDLSLSSCN